MATLALRDVKKSFGPTQVLHGVSHLPNALTRLLCPIHREHNTRIQVTHFLPHERR